MNSVFQVSVLIQGVREATPVVLETDQFSVVLSDIEGAVQAAIDAKAAALSTAAVAAIAPATNGMLT